MSAPKLSAAERLRIAREKNPLPSSAPALALAVKPELPTNTAPVAVAPLQLAGPAAQLQLTGPAAPLKLAGPVSPDPGKGLEPAPVGALYSQLAAVSVVRARQGHSPELRPRLSPDAPPAQAQRDEQRAGERGGVHAANAGTPGAAERLRLAREANPLERLGQGAAPAYPAGPNKGARPTARSPRVAPASWHLSTLTCSRLMTSVRRQAWCIRRRGWFWCLATSGRSFPRA